MEPYKQPQSDWDQDLRDLSVRLAVAGLYLVAIILIGTIGYKIIAPDVSWLTSLYMTTITLTTVGFTEVVPLTGRPLPMVFTIFLVLAGMGGVLYFISTATAFLLEGELGHVFWRRRMERKSSQLTGHIIVCGSGSTAVYTAAEIRSVNRPMVIVCEDQEWMEPFRHELQDVPILLGDPTEEEVLEKAGLERAAGVVACTRSDKDNLLITVMVRQLSPSIRIVARVTDVHGRKRVERAGANAVVAPTYIGGLRMASELLRPTVVGFLDEMLRDKNANLRIDEVKIPPTSSSVGRPLGEIGLEAASDALLLACWTPDGWRYNPPKDLKLTPGAVLVLMGSPGDLRAVCDAVEGEMVALPTKNEA